MNISNVNWTWLLSTGAKVEPDVAGKLAGAQPAQAGEVSAQRTNMDTFEWTGQADPSLYTSRAAARSPLSPLTAEEARYSNYYHFMRCMIAEQGERARRVLFGTEDLPKDLVELAEASLSEGGEFSVDAVATRIMDLATALSDGDSDRIATLRSAVEKGFAAAGDMLGGKLPEVSQATYAECMSRFDTWEAQAASTDSELSSR